MSVPVTSIPAQPIFPVGKFPRKFRVREAIQGLIFTGILWSILVGVALTFDGKLELSPTIQACFRVVDNAEVVSQVAPDLVDGCRQVAEDRDRAHSEMVQNFYTFGLIVQFLWLKSYLLIVRTEEWDPFGASLIAANLAFSVLYLYVMGSSLWDSWRQIDWSVDLNRFGVDYIFHFGLQAAARDLIIVVIGWGIMELLRVPDLLSKETREDLVLIEAARIMEEREALQAEGATS